MVVRISMMIASRCSDVTKNPTGPPAAQLRHLTIAMRSTDLNSVREAFATWLWAGRSRAPAPARMDDAMDVSQTTPGWSSLEDGATRTYRTAKAGRTAEQIGRASCRERAE